MSDSKKRLERFERIASRETRMQVEILEAIDRALQSADADALVDSLDSLSDLRKSVAEREEELRRTTEEGFEKGREQGRQESFEFHQEEKSDMRKALLATNAVNTVVSYTVGALLGYYSKPKSLSQILINKIVKV